MLETKIFLLGLLLFFAAGILFALLKKKNQKLGSINLMISFITMLSYAVLFAGLGAVLSAGDQLIYPTRWLFYIISCSLLMWETGLLLKKDKKQLLEMIFFNSLVMLAGFFASITFGYEKWLFFIISSIAFSINLIIIFQKSTKQTEFMKNIKYFIIITWSLFPLVWIFAPTGIEILSPGITALLYLLLDFVTKIFYGYYILSKNTLK
jgi:sensory rhodopsin